MATQVATQLEKLPDPENLGSSAEKLFQPVALASAFTGLALYAIGTGFGVAAMLEILAIAMMFLHGFLPMHRVLNSESSQPAAILENVETATKRGAWSICSILFLMAVLPLLASRYLPQNPDAPFELLTLIVGVPALLMMMFALTSTPAKPGLRSRVFGIFNILIILYVLLLWVLFLVATTLTTNQPSTVGAVGQFNRYIYFVGPLAAATLGINGHHLQRPQPVPQVLEVATREHVGLAGARPGRDDDAGRRLDGRALVAVEAHRGSSGDASGTRYGGGRRSRCGPLRHTASRSQKKQTAGSGSGGKKPARSEARSRVSRSARSPGSGGVAGTRARVRSET